MTQITSKQIEANKENQAVVYTLLQDEQEFGFGGEQVYANFQDQCDNAISYPGVSEKMTIAEAIQSRKFGYAANWSDAALALLVEPTPDYTYILECLCNRDLVVGYWGMSEEDAIEQAFSHEQDPAEYNRLAQTVTDGHEFFNDYKFHSEHRTPVYIRNDAPANALAYEYQSAGHIATNECHRLIYITAR